MWRRGGVDVSVGGGRRFRRCRLLLAAYHSFGCRSSSDAFLGTIGSRSPATTAFPKIVTMATHDLIYYWGLSPSMMVGDR